MDGESNVNLEAANHDDKKQAASRADEALAEQLDESCLRSSMKSPSNTQSTPSVTGDLAQYLIANIEMLPKARKARRLKAELHFIVQRYLLVRSLVSELHSTIRENERIEEEELRSKATSPRLSPRLATSASKLEPPTLLKRFFMPKHLELEAEKVKIFYDPQF